MERSNLPRVVPVETPGPGRCRVVGPSVEVPPPVSRPRDPSNPRDPTWVRRSVSAIFDATGRSRPGDWTAPLVRNPPDVRPRDDCRVLGVFRPLRRPLEAGHRRRCPGVIHLETRRFPPSTLAAALAESPIGRPAEPTRARPGPSGLAGDRAERPARDAKTKPAAPAPARSLDRPPAVRRPPDIARLGRDPDDDPRGRLLRPRRTCPPRDRRTEPTTIPRTRRGIIL